MAPTGFNGPVKLVPRKLISNIDASLGDASQVLAHWGVGMKQLADKPQVTVPENGLNIAKSRANTWLVGIPQCGHNMIYERPEDLRRLIVEYIARQSSIGQ
jgi:pimeloyl-ACP methyl ester carboxylesterase